HFAAGGPAAAGVVSARAAALAEGALRAMWATRMKAAAAAVLVAGLLAGGLSEGVYYGTLNAAPPVGRDPPTSTVADPAASDKDLLNVPSQRDGILLVVGTEIKKGEKVAPERIVSVKIDGEEQKYLRLRVGDRVEEGQLLARLDDRLARDDLEAKKSKVEAAVADWNASLKARDEAEQRYKTLERLWKGQVRNTISLEDVRGAKLTWDRYFFEEIAKKAAIKQARVEMKAAQTVVEMYEVRSPARGVVTRLYKRRGEAVKYLEPVVQIRVSDG
ncbi:MAG TPA: hypothetical protein VJ739_08130, partial [Gemmataceae bacterium]|nr:hypothetical protein [Gemmataceae bacterium]